MRRRRSVTGWARRPERLLTARRQNDIAWRRAADRMPLDDE
jgi:hypothetical protein